MLYLLIGFPLAMAAATFAVPSKRWRPCLMLIGGAGHLVLVVSAPTFAASLPTRSLPASAWPRCSHFSPLPPGRGAGGEGARLTDPPSPQSSEGEANNLHLYAVLTDNARAILRVARTLLDSDHVPSLTAACPQAQLFEREIAEQYGTIFDGHPWFKPVRFHPSYRPGHDARSQPPQVGVMDFYRVEGDEVHEVAVGPVHAGISEPRHFRFQCHGEQVFHLEISLGYQHRGAERTLTSGPTKRTIHTIETMAGDMHCRS